MYAAVRQTAEDNTPDTYLPMGGAAKKLLGEKANSDGSAAQRSASAAAEPDTATSSNGLLQGPEATSDAASGKPLDSSKAKDSALNMRPSSNSGGVEGAKEKAKKMPDEAGGEASGKCYSSSESQR